MEGSMICNTEMKVHLAVREYEKVNQVGATGYAVQDKLAVSSQEEVV